MLLDTSGLLCFYHRDEELHTVASEFYEAATNKITHNYVLAEFVALANVRGLARRGALEFVRGVTANPNIEIVWVDQGLNDRALALLQSRLDKTYSLCDAVSFILMERRGITEALTTDHHFTQAGFRRLLV